MYSYHVDVAVFSLFDIVCGFVTADVLCFAKLIQVRNKASTMWEEKSSWDTPVGLRVQDPCILGDSRTLATVACYLISNWLDAHRRWYSYRDFVDTWWHWHAQIGKNSWILSAQIISIMEQTNRCVASSLFVWHLWETRIAKPLTIHSLGTVSFCTKLFCRMSTCPHWTAWLGLIIFL